MALSFSLTFNSVANLVYSLNSGTARIASTSTGSSGQLASTSGVVGATSVNWSLSGAPSWLTINTSGVISFSGVTTAITGEFNFAVVATDSSNPSNVGYYPVTVEVLPNITIAESTGLTNITVTTLNPAVQNQIIAKGADGTTVLSGVDYVLVSSTPTGLNFRTDGNSAFLYGNLQSILDIRGGIKTPGSASITVKAFKEGTFYDHPDRAISLTLNYTINPAAAGDLRIAISGYADSYNVTSGNVPIRLHARAEVDNGAGDVTSSTSYTWSATGLAGTFLDSANSSSTVWSPGATGQVTFNLSVATTGTISPSYNAASLTMDIATGTTWTSTTILKMIPADATKMESLGASGSLVNFGVKLTDLTGGEVATITAAVTPIGSAPAASSPTVSIPSYTATNSTNGDVCLIGLTIPSGASVGHKYSVLVSASTSGGARIADLQYYVVCTGAPSLVITPTSSSVSFNTGVLYTTSNPLFTITSSQPSTTFNLVNAPAGLYVDQASGKVIGKAYKGSIGTLKIYVSNTGYLTSDATTVNYTVNEIDNIVNLSLSTATPVISPGSNLTVNWGYSGVADSFVLQKNNETPITITGTVSTYTFNNVTSNSTISLYSTNGVGASFAAPIEVLVSSTGTVTRLPQSPTIAVLNQDNTVDVSWSPIPLGSDPAHYYDDYLNWNIIYKTTSMTNEAISIGSPFTGKESGGTDSSRNAKITISPSPLSSDTVYLDMQAFSAVPNTVLDSYRWDKSDNNPPFNLKSFPTFGTVTLDKTTASKNEPITVTISGFTGDKWRIVFQDGTYTSFLPLNISSTTIAFSTGGVNQILTIQVENDYSSSLPSVKLRSAVTTSVFIIDQDYVVPGVTDVFGNVGFGGEAGFEITDATAGQVALDPYISIVRALVKDEVTNELKLMVATSRTKDSSSSFGTMAIDVFPILGRPHLKDLVTPVPFTTYSSSTIVPVNITTNLLPDLIIGQFTEIALNANGGTAPYSWFASDLPQGLTMSSDGTIHGSVLQLGVYQITVSVADSSNPTFIDNKTFNLVVKSDLVISSTTISNPVVNTVYSQPFATTGGVGPFTWAFVGGQLPKGLSVNPVTGYLEGTPVTYTSTDITNYTFVVQVTDSVGAKASKQFTITLLPAALSISDLDQKILYKTESFRMTASIFGGVPPYSGLTITDTNGILSTSNSRINNGLIEFDVPSSANNGNYSFTVQVSDSSSTIVSKTLSYTINPALGQLVMIDPIFNNFYNTTENADHYVNVANIPGATITLNTSSPLSNGATLTYNDTTKQLDLKGPISAGQGKNLEFRTSLSITGTTSDGAVSREYTVLSYTGAFTALSPGVMNITTIPYEVGNLVTLDPQRPYFSSVSTSRNSTWKVRLQAGQTLPKGLSLDSTTGLIYGTLLDTDVTNTIIEYVQTTGEVVGTLNVAFNLIPVKGINIDMSNLGSAIRGTAYTGTVSIGDSTNTLPMTVTLIKGSLPPGITYSTTNNTITFSGTPTEGGFFDTWFKIVDSSSPVKSSLMYKRFEVSYSSVLRISTDTLPLIISGVAYTASISATGGVSPYSFSLAPGSPALPSGITLGSNGVFSGSSTDTTYNSTIIVQVQDTNSTIVTKSFNLKVDSGYTMTVADTGTLGNWPIQQPYLGNIVQLNYSGTFFGSFMVRVSGLDSTNYLPANASSSI